MEVGLVGLPNSGKSTLFNALTSGCAKANPFPFCTVDPNRGVVALPDHRLAKVAELAGQEQVTPASLGVVDIAGLVKGASTGEGLGNEFLSHVREADALFHLIRLFEGDDVPHFYGRLDPKADAEIVETELVLADLGSVERRLSRIAEKVKGRQKEYIEENEALKYLRSQLEAGTPLSRVELDEEHKLLAQGLYPLTMKPVLYVLNTGAGGDPGYWRQVKDSLEADGRDTFIFNAQVESELVDLDPEEKEAFRQEYGLDPEGPSALIAEAFKLLDLISFFTLVGKEARAWRIKRGTSAEDAAGKIHSDMKLGFIKAEVALWSDLLNSGSWARARDQGLVLVHGRDYVVRDGDVMHFKFRAPAAGS